MKRRLAALVDSRGQIGLNAAGGALVGGALGALGGRSGIRLETAIPGALLGGSAAALGTQMAVQDKADKEYMHELGIQRHPQFFKRLMGRHLVTEDARRKYVEGKE